MLRNFPEVVGPLFCSERIKDAPDWGPPFRVTFCPQFPDGEKLVDSYRRSCRDSMTSHRNRAFSGTGKRQRLLGSDFGRTDFSRIFIFGPPDFFADFLAGFFLLIFVGKSVQKNPPGKSPAKLSKFYTTKILQHTSADWPGQQSPLREKGQRRHKTVTTIWCMFDCPWQPPRPRGQTWDSNFARLYNRHALSPDPPPHPQTFGQCH